MSSVAVVFVACAPAVIQGYCNDDSQSDSCVAHHSMDLLWLLITIPLVLMYYYYRCCYSPRHTVIREVQVLVISTPDDPNNRAVEKPSQSDAPPAYPDHPQAPPPYSPSAPSVHQPNKAPSVLPPSNVPYQPLVD